MGSLTATDFESLRSALAKRFGPVRLTRDIKQVRMIFRYCYEAGHLDAPLRFGPHFKPPKERELRLNRENSELKLFSAAELTTLIHIAPMPLRAMVLLSLNAGFGNHDVGLLRFNDLSLKQGWHNMRRPKTGISRRAKLWPDTVDAITESIHRRPETNDPDVDDLVFLTKYRLSWYKETRANPLAREFRKLLDKCKLYRLGRTFYALRHTFETIAGESRDQVAVDHIMGHVPGVMSARYRERISDERLEAVSEFVYKWFQSAKVEQSA